MNKDKQTTFLTLGGRGYGKEEALNQLYAFMEAELSVVKAKAISKDKKTRFFKGDQLEQSLWESLDEIW